MHRGILPTLISGNYQMRTGRAVGLGLLPIITKLPAAHYDRNLRVVEHYQRVL